MLDLRRDEDVYVLRFDEGENRLSPTLLDEATAGRALVTTGVGKFRRSEPPTRPWRPGAGTTARTR